MRLYEYEYGYRIPFFERKMILKFCTKAKKNIHLFPEDRPGDFFFQSGRCFNFFFNLTYTISPLLNFCEKMEFLNISERCLKINRTSTYVRGHHVKS